MEKVYISLGSNIGDRTVNLNRAIDIFKSDKKFSNITVSSFYETDPQGYIDQERFINCAIGFYTEIKPDKLLEYCQDIEKKLKRVKLFRWGPRIIDVDILIYGDKTVNTGELIIPHPRMFERAFVLAPLSEIDSSYYKFLEKLPDQGVKRI